MRDLLKRQPLLGWALAAAMLLLAGFFAWRNYQADDTVQLTQMVTIRCTETGETWQVPRGALEKDLYMRAYPVDPNQGLVNPKTGKPTGFPIDDWAATVASVNAARKVLAEATGAPSASAPTTPPPSK